MSTWQSAVRGAAARFFHFLPSSWK